MESIIRNCDKCGNEDTINCVSGLCPSCENKEKETEINNLKEINEDLRSNIDLNLKLYMTNISDEYDDIWSYINQLINNEIEQESYCNE